jgi:hypothetical protein
MKSNPSTESKTKTKTKPKRTSGQAPAPKPKAAAKNPFQNLNSASADLLIPLIQAIETDLLKKGLKPGEIRSTTDFGIEYHMTVNHALALEIEVSASDTGEQLMFSIRADLGRVLKGPERSSFLEALLMMNLGSKTPFRFALTRNDFIRVLYSARVSDELSMGRIGELLDQLVASATGLRLQLMGQRLFQDLFSQIAEDESTPPSPQSNFEGWLQ